MFNFDVLPPIPIFEGKIYRNLPPISPPPTCRPRRFLLYPVRSRDLSRTRQLQSETAFASLTNTVMNPGRTTRVSYLIERANRPAEKQKYYRRRDETRRNWNFLFIALRYYASAEYVGETRKTVRGRERRVIVV